MRYSMYLLAQKALALRSVLQVSHGSGSPRICGLYGTRWRWSGLGGRLPGKSKGRWTRGRLI